MLEKLVNMTPRLMLRLMKKNMFALRMKKVVIKDLEKEFKELDERLDKLSDTDGYDIKRYREEHHSLEKAKEVLAKAGKLE
ncbi:MAG: Hypothetical protein LKU_00422 [Lactobacillus kefiranofaciens]|nr:hypothetical protein FC93_GL000844 [Lactobacillus kefiranofaciens subsp. kefiranofaciens DSM 5016 = JCM 6985]